MRIFRVLFLLLISSSAAASAAAQSPAAPPTVFLWPEGAPGAVGGLPEDKPHLEVFLPDAATLKLRNPRTAVLILPGGAYHVLAMDKEGEDPAHWFNQLGVAAFVLSYRLGPRYRFPAPFDDATRAIRYIRAHAAEYGVDPDRVGVMGFSAGGHLASTLGTRPVAANASAADPLEHFSNTPDFLILGYPVIDPLGPASIVSYDFLLGEPPDKRYAVALFNDQHVTAQTPPTFLVAASDDDAVLPQNSLNFYEALLKAKVPAELHLYEHGGHGFGMAPLDPVLRTWMDQLQNWLEFRGYLSARAK